MKLYWPSSRRSRRSLRLSRGLGTRLFVSHFLVAVVVALTMLTAVLLVAPFVLGSVTGGAGEVMGPLVWALGQTLLFSLLAAGLVATATAAIASLFVSRRVVGSLRYVLEATRRIAAGGYGERVPVVEADDEIGELSESFNAMAKALEEAERRRVEVISDVSHELRTPLSTLRGYLESVMGGAIEPSEETFSLLYGETRRLERLVNDLRQLSRAEAGKLALNVVPFSPAEAVRAATEGMRPLFEEKGVELKAITSSDLPPVLADADRVAQVLTNLLDNALRHTPAGGLVAVEAVSGTGEVTFWVTDSGEGISAEHLGRIFERFYRVEKSRSRSGPFGGSGVGLSISRALVEAMGGRIWAESLGLGCGAAFYFTLPASERRAMSGS